MRWKARSGGERERKIITSLFLGLKSRLTLKDTLGGIFIVTRQPVSNFVLYFQPLLFLPLSHPVLFLIIFLLPPNLPSPHPYFSFFSFISSFLLIHLFPPPHSPSPLFLLLLLLEGEKKMKETSERKTL